MIKKWAAVALLGWFFVLEHDLAGLPGAKAKSMLGPFIDQATCEMVRESFDGAENYFANFKLGKCTEVKPA